MAAGERGGNGRPRLTRAERERVFQRRRRVAIAALAGGVLLLFLLGQALFGGDGDGASADKPPELPRGGRVVLPGNRVVAYYGAPQSEELGVLGIGTPNAAARKLLDQAKGFASRRRPVLPAMELVATIAHAEPGEDGMHRQRQRDAVIRRYLAAARRIRALLILDIQPGQASFTDEVRAFERYLLEPDVGIALDPEWSMAPGVVPGQEIGSTDADTVNDVSAYMAQLVQTRDLPQKLLIVHQFTEEMVEDRESILARPGVAIVSNVDGFGTPELKTGVYGQLTERDALPSGRAGDFTGFKLFYEEDTDLMRPSSVLALRPQPSVIVYE